jgi:hypothetical protein
MVEFVDTSRRLSVDLWHHLWQNVLANYTSNVVGGVAIEDNIAKNQQHDMLSVVIPSWYIILYGFKFASQNT